MGFIDTMRAEGHAVESICRVLREQGCQIAARTYRAWKHTGRRVPARTITDAHVVDAVRENDRTSTTGRASDLVGAPRPQGPTGRRQMTAALRGTTLPEASAGPCGRGIH